MKVLLVLTLHLFIFTDCQANPFYADEPKPQLERLTERLVEELNTVKCALKPYIEYVTDPVEKGVNHIRLAMAPYADSLDTETLKATFLQRIEELRGTLEQHMKELQAQLEPFTEELKEKTNLYTRELKALFTSFY